MFRKIGIKPEYVFRLKQLIGCYNLKISKEARKEVKKMENEKWYAVMTNRDDNDWGTGSFDRYEAEKMVVKNLDIYPEGYIAVIVNDTCVDKIATEDFSAPFMYAARVIKAHDWDACQDDLNGLMRSIQLETEWSEADGDTFEDVIRKAGEMIGVNLI